MAPCSGTSGSPRIDDARDSFGVRSGGQLETWGVLRMSDQQMIGSVRGYFEGARKGYTRLAGTFVEDPDVVIDDASRRFDEMIPGLAYLDAPDHPMASALFGCSATLAVYLALRDRGVDVHDFGRAFLEGMTWMMAKAPERERTEESREALRAAAEASQRDTKRGEFMFEIVAEDGFDSGMNILSCGICFEFSKHDAMDLVPYMCATDDVVSDRFDEGLRRTGTIALGAHHCDFRYRKGGQPNRVADNYPERIAFRPKR